MIAMPPNQDRRIDTDKTYASIREKICLLDYPPGMALKEEAIATEYGMSRTPIRRVLLQLEFDGLVSHTHGSGAIVSTLDLRSLKQVYELRLKLSEFMGEMMSPRIPEEDFAKLDELIEQLSQMNDEHDPRELARLYNTFHDIANRMISNLALRRVADQLYYQTARVWLDILPDLDWQDEVNIVREEISEVRKHAAAGDMLAVSRVRREHMSMMLKRINLYLGSANTN